MSDELKTCTWCGRECRVETFGPSEFIENPFSIWVCSNAEIFGGTCTHALAYMSEEDWQEEPRSDELIEAMARELAPHMLAMSGDYSEVPPYQVLRPNDRPRYAHLVIAIENAARAILPVIRAHLEPTSEMLAIGNDAVDTCTKVDPCDNPAKHIWADMLAASPIGDVG